MATLDADAGLAGDEVRARTEPEARYDLVVAHYLSESISLSRAAELLDMPWLELRTRFQRLDVPLRTAPDDKLGAVDDVAAAGAWSHLTIPDPIIVDNTVLTHLAIVGRPDLITLLWGDRACTTPEVMAASRAATEAGLLPGGARDALPLVEMTEDEVDDAHALGRRLGAGERSCLAVALERDGLVLTDDADARAVADYYGIQISGTLGVLALSVRRGHLTLVEGNGLLAEIIAAGYRSPVENLDALR